MKTFGVALFSLVTIMCSGQSMDNYYWYFDKKVPIETASDDVLLISNDEKSLEDARRWTLGRQTVVGVYTTPYKALQLQLQPNLIERNALIEGLQRAFPQLVVSPSIIHQGSTIGVLNQVILKPKGKDAQAVIQRFGSAIRLLRASKYNTYLFEISSTSNCVNLANRIQESGLVEFCQPNFIGGIKLANPLYPDQYYLNNTGQFGGTPGIDINAPEAWNITQGCGNVRVAVIDQGVAEHEDMAGRVVNGFDPLFPNNPGRPLNANDNHGTACAGIIGAGNNLIGIRGVASNAIIVPVKIFDGNTAYAVGDIADAINWAWDNGAADILSNSWGGGNPNAAITNAINNALTLGRGGLGSVVVASTGNDWPLRNFVAFPASINNVLSVGAIDRNGNLWGYSQRGNEMDLVAPSGDVNLMGDIRTTDRPGADGYENPDNYTNRFGGTSAACPQVAGVAALMLSANPSLTEAQVRNLLQQTATDMGPGGFDNDFGFGRVNAEAAVRSALGGNINGSDLICSSNTFSLGQPIPGTINWSTSNSNGLVIDGNGVATRVGDFNGLVDILASTANGCGSIRRTVYVGNPDLTKMVNGVPAGTMAVSPGSQYNLAAFSSSPNTSFNYNDYTGSGDMTITLYNPNSANTQMYVYSTSTSGQRRVKVTASNSCGTYSEDFVFYVYSGFRTYPNPAKESFTVEFTSAEEDKFLPDELELLSEKTTETVRKVNLKEMYQNRAFRDGNKVDFDVRDLPRGIYYLKVKNARQEDGKQTQTVRLSLE